jgi:hypothetical protein
MAYVLIPEGFTLKKVTKAEQRAVDEHFGRERRGDYFENFLGNPNAPIVVGGLITTYLAANVAGDIIDKLEETVGPVAKTTKKAIEETVDIRLNRPAAIREAIINALSRFEIPEESLLAGLRR